jgi:hypothetical protein
MPRFANNALRSENVGTDRVRPKVVVTAPLWKYLLFSTDFSESSPGKGQVVERGGEECSTMSEILGYLKVEGLSIK